MKKQTNKQMKKRTNKWTLIKVGVVLSYHFFRDDVSDVTLLSLPEFRWGAGNGVPIRRRDGTAGDRVRVLLLETGSSGRGTGGS